MKYLLAQSIEKISKETKHYVDSKQKKQKTKEKQQKKPRINLKTSILFFNNIDDGQCQSFVSFFRQNKQVPVEDSISHTAWKVSKYGVFSGPNTEKLGPEKTLCLDTFHGLKSHLLK